MPDTPSITIVKSFTYRGQNEKWSNKYHFTGDTPANPAAWKALAQAIWDQEKTFLGTVVRYAGYLGHEAGNEFAVANEDFLTDGSAAQNGSIALAAAQPPGDVAQRIRWRTPDRTSRGKIIYLSKYFHGVGFSVDQVTAPTRAAMEAYAAKMIDGTLPGGFKYCGPQGATASQPKVMQFISYRQLKRTGKRPSR